MANFPTLPGRFMTVRDIALFLRSARTDAAIAKSRLTQSLGEAMEGIYAGSDDPWGSASRDFLYQRRKYEVMASLIPPGDRFGQALDVGCGVGGMTRHLAHRSDAVLGIDIAPTAVALAQTATQDLSNVAYECANLLDLPAAMDGKFDFIVISDVLYYLSPLSDGLLKLIASRVSRLLAGGGICMLANHFFFSLDRSSRESRRIHESFRWSAELSQISDHRRPFFIVSLLRRTEAEPALAA